MRSFYAQLQALQWYIGEAEKPDGLLQTIDQLLTNPDHEIANLFCQSIYDFTKWPEIPEGWPTRFMQDSEWSWRTGTPPLTDW